MSVDWEEMDRLDAFGTFGGRIVPYNGVWKIMLNETNCELWSLKTHAEAVAKLDDAIKKSGYSDDENPLVELARLKALQPEARESMGEWTIRRDGAHHYRICSEDFKHDAELILTGDFKNESDRMEYAAKIARKLSGKPLDGSEPQIERSK